MDNKLSLKTPEPTILELICKVLCDAADFWEEIAKLLNHMLDDQVTILNPQQHDRLSFDDNTFSRSRRYFWPVECLDVFKTDIRDAVKQWEYFWSTWEELLERLQKGCVKNRSFRHENDEQGREIIELRPDSEVSEVVAEIETQIRRLREFTTSQSNVKLLPKLTI